MRRIGHMFALDPVVLTGHIRGHKIVPMDAPASEVFDRMNAVYYERASANVCLNCSRMDCRNGECDRVLAVERELVRWRGGKKKIVCK